MDDSISSSQRSGELGNAIISEKQDHQWSNVRGGVLSQTLASSPCIKWILPARLRSPLHKDVVLVRQSSIQLQECKDDGLLVDITSSLELDVRILAAKVVSAKEHTVLMQDAILESGRDETRFTIRGQPCDESQPPQILVLSLASSELIYAYAKESADGVARFVYAKRHIVGGLSTFEKYGQHLAIDPESRALAVAPWKGSFSILSLKDVDEIKREIDNWDPRSPESITGVKEQRAVEVDGTILKMDFLRSTTLEPEKVIILLVVARAGQTRLLLYRWNTRRPINTMAPMRCSGHLLRGEDAFPFLLIPLCTVTSFALVTRNKLICYGDVTGDQVSRTDLDIPCRPEDHSKVWVQWARAVRHEKYKQVNEDIFLIREDGILCTFLVNNASPSASICSTNYKAGDLGIRVDTAMCMLPKSPTMSGDILIAAGDMTEGGVFHLAPISLPKRLQTIPNWNPIHDMLILDHKIPQQIYQPRPPTFVTAGGMEGKGSLMQLSYGFEAIIAWSIEYPEASTADRLWVLEGPANNQLVLLISHHEYTSALLFDPDGEELVIMEEESHPELSLSASTLAAASLPGASLLQITSQNINIVSAQPGRSQQISSELGSYNMCAEIDSASGLFVVASRGPTETILKIGIAVTTENGPVEVSVAPNFQKLDFVPVALCLSSIGDAGFCFVVSQEGAISVYSVDPVQGLKSTMHWNLPELESLSEVESVSSLSVVVPRGSSHALLLCGLKSGRVIFAKVSHVSNGGVSRLRIKVERSESLGNTAIAIKKEECDPSSIVRHVVISCGSNLRRITVLENQSGLEFVTDAIWITSKDDEAYVQAPITGFDRVPTLVSHRGEDPSGLFAFSGGQDILMCVCSSKKVVARRLEHLSAPQFMTYSHFCKKFVIAVNDDFENQWAKRTALAPQDRSPMLQIADPFYVIKRMKIPAIICGQPGDRIRALLEWRPTDGIKHFEMIVVGLQSGMDGRLVYFTAARLQHVDHPPKVKKLFDFYRKPIHAMCAFGYSSLVVCAGREIKILHLDLHDKKVEIQATFELPSSAIAVASQGSVIFVATSLHSFLVLRDDNQQLQVINSASWAGTARHVIPFSDQSVMVNLVSDQGSRVLGFANRLEREVQPTFEANMPLAIDRLAHIKQEGFRDGRDQFQGGTIDGTMYLFTTLTASETKLLKFLEQLVQPYYSARLMKLGLKTVKSSVWSKLEAGSMIPFGGGSSHVRGDVLQRMLEPGRFNIRNLIQPKIKVEEGMEIDGEDNYSRLEGLARPVLQEESPTVAGVIIWLQSLLNSQSF